MPSLSKRRSSAAAAAVEASVAGLAPPGGGGGATEFLQKTDSRGRTALHLAARSGHVALSQLLVRPPLPTLGHAAPLPGARG